MIKMYLASIVKPQPRSKSTKFCHICNGSSVITIKTICSRCRGTCFIYSDNTKIEFRKFYKCPMSDCNKGYIYTKVPCPHPH